MSIKPLYKYWINSTNIIKAMDNFSCFSKNLSNEDMQEDVWDVVPAVPNSSAARNAITAISFFVMVVGLFCNCRYLLIIVKKRLYVEKPTIVLLINLVVINIIICIFVLPFNVVTGIMRGFYYGQSDAIRCHVCRLGVIYVAALFAALTNLSLLSVDRLVYIRMAIKYENIVTNKRILIAIMIAWIYSIAMSFTQNNIMTQSNQAIKFETEASLSLGTRTYDKYTELFHLPNVCIKESSTPTAAAVEAAPIQKI